jgi:hypothetical protein
MRRAFFTGRKSLILVGVLAVSFLLIFEWDLGKLGSKGSPIVAILDLAPNHDELLSLHHLALLKEAETTCTRCRVIAVSVSPNLEGNLADQLLERIQFSFRQGARWIVIPLAFSGLEKRELLKSKVNLDDFIRTHGLRTYVSLGVGVRNPFVPEKVEDLYPHAAEKVILVDALFPSGNRDPAANLAGSRSVLTVKLEPNDESSSAYGSSLAAVRAAAQDASQFLSSDK